MSLILHLADSWSPSQSDSPLCLRPCLLNHFDKKLAMKIIKFLGFFTSIFYSVFHRIACSPKIKTVCGGFWEWEHNIFISRIGSIILKEFLSQVPDPWVALKTELKNQSREMLALLALHSDLRAPESKMSPKEATLLLWMRWEGERRQGKRKEWKHKLLYSICCYTTHYAASGKLHCALVSEKEWR